MPRSASPRRADLEQDRRPLETNVAVLGVRVPGVARVDARAVNPRALGSGVPRDQRGIAPWGLVLA
jgi:hypothetical protein